MLTTQIRHEGALCDRPIDWQAPAALAGHPAVPYGSEGMYFGSSSAYLRYDMKLTGFRSTMSLSLVTTNRTSRFLVYTLCLRGSQQLYGRGLIHLRTF